MSWFKDKFQKGKKYFRNNIKKTFAEYEYSDLMCEDGEVINKWEDEDKVGSVVWDEYYIRIESEKFTRVIKNETYYHDLDIGDIVNVYYKEVTKLIYKWQAPDFEEAVLVKEEFAEYEYDHIEY